MPNQKHYPYDAGLEHRAAGAAAVTASANYATIDQGVATRTDYVTVINATAVKVSAGNEIYTFRVELSNDNFSTIEAVAGNMILGDAAAIPAANDAGVGEYELMWTSEQNDTLYRYWRVVLVAAGTSPSITFSAYSSKRQ